jgi:NAD(P)-dependent dehydrogenase (short-subunit alcohol dehydrogenase family)
LLRVPAKHNLVILGGRSQDALDKLKAQSPKRIEVVPGDLSDFSLAQKAVELAVSAFGKIDGLVVNHGTLGEVARIADYDLEEIRKTFDVNFFSAIACVS